MGKFGDKNSFVCDGDQFDGYGIEDVSVKVKMTRAKTM